MNRLGIIFVLLLAVPPASFSAIHTVVNSAFTFSPATLTVNAGDTVTFVLASIHSAREVSLATWNADGSTSNGGFDTPFGGGTIVLSQVGAHYYVCANHYFMGMKGTINVVVATGVKEQHSGIPAEFALGQNFPNPFNPATTISFNLPVTSRVSVKVLDVEGELVATLLDQVQAAGYRSVSWNGSNNASGIYFCRMEAKPVSGPGESFTKIRKMLLLK
jgi:plastocyanin